MKDLAASARASRNELTSSSSLFEWPLTHVGLSKKILEKITLTANYIGLACTFHDPAVAVVNSRGDIVFAEATERHLQSKRAYNIAPDYLAYIPHILEQHCERGVDLVVAKSWSNGTLRRIRQAKTIQKLCSRWIPNGSKWAMASNVSRTMLVSMGSSLGFASEGIRHQLDKESIFGLSQRNIEIRGYDHHLCHAAAGCFTSPFEEAVCAVVDGYGEGGSLAFFHYQKGRLQRLRSHKRSVNSLGFFYMRLCLACGFDPVNGEEWKVMSLAGHGKRNGEVYKRLKPALRVKGLRLLGAARQYTNALWRFPSTCSPEDLAFTGQALYEESMAELLRNLYSLGLSENLVLAGGCALNSSWNGRILNITPFRRLYVYSAPADDGNAVGAALLAYYEDNPERRPSGRFQSPYLGESMSTDSLQRVVRSGAMSKVTQLPGSMHLAAARMLADGKIVGWVQGRAEFGPRALGNRSILADPRRADIKNTLNRTIKRRESFRPFAPAILHEHGPTYFTDYQESPYMERALRFRAEVIDRVPAVVHVDGTGRLQTVKREWNEDFHRLLHTFFVLTSIPVLLNTSFNVMGKPIIHTVEDAVAVFASSALDALVIDDYLFEKRC
jgi:carbamoyltransferase